MSTLLTVYLIGGGCLCLFSIPLIFRIVPPNPVYGFRVAQTLGNPPIWYAINALSGKWLFVDGVLTIFTATGFYLIPEISIDTYALACAGIILSALCISLLICFLRLGKISSME